MGILLDSTPMELVLGLLLLFWSFYRYMTKDYDFWAKRGVPYRKPEFPFGSLKDFILSRVHTGEAYDAVYKEFAGEKVCGVVELHRPILVIRDPDLVKQILIRDFNVFTDRAPFDVNPNESIAKHLFLMEGEDWRNMRHKLSPAFSSGKMKNMFSLMLKCSEQLNECLDKMTETQESIDVKELLAKFTMDIIATCAFGLEINSLVNPDTEFFKIGTVVFKPSASLLIKHKLIALFPLLARVLNIQSLEPEPKKMLHSMVSNTVKYREENNVSRNDFLDILIKLKHNKSILDGAEDETGPAYVLKPNQKEGLTLEQMTAQAFVFFIAGFETASSTMTFCLYELARHPEVQERLWREVDEVLQSHGGQVTYQALQDMKYMDQVINETLRLYASLSVLHRRCNQSYKLPGCDLQLERGQKVIIPIYSLHHDPQYYPQPDQFDPDRFTAENVKNRHPFVHLPFGDGPRNCIGMRFGLMQTKIGLSTFLFRFRVDMSADTPVPLKPLPSSFVTLPKDPVFLKVTRR